MKIFAVCLMETTEHLVHVEADNDSEARDEAVRGWKEGEYVDDRPELVSLKPVHTYEMLPISVALKED